MLEILVKILTSEVVLGAVVSGVGALILYFNRKKAADKAAHDREDFFEKAAVLAYDVVNDISKTTATKVDDKAALALEKLVAYFRTHKLEPTPAELDRAKLVFSALHGQER